MCLAEVSAQIVIAHTLDAAGIACVYMPVLALAKHRTGRALGNRPLIADAAESAFCAFTSSAALTLSFASSMFAVTVARVAPVRSKRRLGVLRVFFHLLHEAGIHIRVILAIAAALGAYFASGVLRVVLITLAVLLGALVIWDVLLAAYGTGLMWGLKHWIEQRRARKMD